MLNGELVTLRAIEPADHPKLASYLNDVEVELLGGGDPPTPRSLASVSAMLERQADDSGAVNFAITVGDELIGQCGMFGQDHIAQTAEIGIVIGERAYWGRGYGRDAVRLLVDYGFRMRNLHKLWLTVHADNARAIRAYESVGFTEEGRQRAQVWSAGSYVDLVYMGLIRRRKP